MFQRVTILGITKLTGFNEKYGLFDGIGHSSIGSNKTGSRRMDKKHPTKKYIARMYNSRYYKLFTSPKYTIKYLGFPEFADTPALGAT